MHISLKRTSILAAAGLTLLPLGAAHAASNAVLLRYRFAQGQTYTYKVIGQMRIGAGGSGGGLGSLGLASILGDTSPLTVTASVRYHVLSVDSSGGADIQVTTSNATETRTKDGQTASKPLDAAPPYTIHVNPNGSETATPDLDIGAFGLQALGTLPAAPVAPGAHWSATTTLNTAALLGSATTPLQVPVQYTFTKYQGAGSQRSAAIDAAGTVNYAFDMTTNAGTPVHVTLNGALTGHSLFGLSTHRLVASQIDMDLKPTLGKRHRNLGGLGLLPHIYITIAIQPSGQ